MRKVLFSVATATVVLAQAHAVTITLDYFHESDGGALSISSNATAQAAINKAAADVSAVLTNTMTAVSTDVYTGTAGTSSATTNWYLTYKNPATGATQTLNTFSFAVDEIRIYVGMQNLSGSTLGQGGLGGSGIQLSGSSGTQWAGAVADMENQSNAAMTRSSGPVSGTLTVADFGGASASLSYGVMLGNLWFDSDKNNDSSTDTWASLETDYWHTDANTAVGAGKSDLYSVALHEILHAVGFGTSDTWDSMVSGTDWTGAEVAALLGNGDGVLDGDGSHIASGKMSQNIYTLARSACCAVAGRPK